MDFLEREKLLNQTFTPRSPVNQRQLFAGRIAQLAKVQSAVASPGTHAVLYGERGVGKTSLANMAEQIVPVSKDRMISIKVTCNSVDTYSTVWRKAFSKITYSEETKSIGFIPESSVTTRSFADSLPLTLTPDDVERALASLRSFAPIFIIFDEFDRVYQASSGLTLPFSDTIKSLSDNNYDVTILIVGVADSIGNLIEKHESIERAIVQIPMPRMSKTEIGQILDTGAARLEMSITETAREQIIKLSQGLPYITHLIAQHSFSEAIQSEHREVDTQHVSSGIQEALNEWQASIKSDYVKAITSVQKKNIFKEVLLACALAEMDEIGDFAAADVRSPLREITGQSYDIPNFARHLKEFSSLNRGEIIERTGQAKRLRYRFNNPLMRTYVIIRGVVDGMISLNKIRA